MKDITLESNLKAVLGPGLDKTNKASQIEAGKTFSETLEESLNQVNVLQNDADSAIEDLSTGKSHSIHETMISVNKADIAFRMTMQVRNKIVEAYQEVLRLQV
tara:strand:+ start:700 stop:1008 length:309 start_codon:yes stop_codon:yes gene_type:complete